MRGRERDFRETVDFKISTDFGVSSNFLYLRRRLGYLLRPFAGRVPIIRTNVHRRCAIPMEPRELVRGTLARRKLFERTAIRCRSISKGEKNWPGGFF